MNRFQTGINISYLTLQHNKTSLQLSCKTQQLFWFSKQQLGCRHITLKVKWIKTWVLRSGILPEMRRYGACPATDTYTTCSRLSITTISLNISAAKAPGTFSWKYLVLLRSCTIICCSVLFRLCSCRATGNEHGITCTLTQHGRWIIYIWVYSIGEVFLSVQSRTTSRYCCFQYYLNNNSMSVNFFLTEKTHWNNSSTGKYSCF